MLAPNSPGDSPGTLTIAGDYTQFPGAVLDIELGGFGLAPLPVAAQRGVTAIAGGEITHWHWSARPPSISATRSSARPA